MIQLLRSLLGGSPREYLAKKPAPGARPGQLNAGGDYRAVSLAPSRMSCGREGRRGQALFVERSAAPALGELHDAGELFVQVPQARGPPRGRPPSARRDRN